MVEKNCSEAARNSGEMLGSRKGRYSVHRGKKRNRLFTLTHSRHTNPPVFFVLWILTPSPSPNPPQPRCSPNSLTCVIRRCLLQEAGQPLIHRDVLRVKRGGNGRPALEQPGQEGSELKEGLGVRRGPGRGSHGRDTQTGEGRRFPLPTRNEGRGEGQLNNNHEKTSGITSALPPYHSQGLSLDGSCLGRGVSGWACPRMEGSAGQRSLPGTRTWGQGRATDLVGGDDPLARVLEQLFVSPERVLAGQLLCPQVVVAEPEQAQRLQEGLAVPSLRPEGCPRGGDTGEELSAGGPEGGAPRRSPARAPAASPYSPRDPRRPVAGSGAVHMRSGSCAFRGKAGSGPDASRPPEKLRSSSLQECEEP